MALVAGVCVAAIVGVVGVGPVTSAIGCAWQQVTGGGSCTTSSITGPVGASADDGDRRDAERDTRGNRRDDARGDRPSDEDPGTPPEGGTEGSDAYPGGLGPGVPGTTVPGGQQPPPWTPPDQGAGPYAGEDPSIRDRATLAAAEAAANALSGTWPDAARNLLHFLGNSGETYEQDVDSMLESSSALTEAVDAQQLNLAALAVEQARAAGATGPMTFPVNTPWNGVYITKDDSANWFYALGGISYNQTGSVTVTPPASPGEPWTYTTTTQVNIRDRYNWDGGKSTRIGPLTITDEQLARLHRVGLAQEFTAVGTSSTQNSSGEVP
ncbi:ICP22 family protein [Phycicoccus flavus]|uniref:Uncharacterized protein n=1 Tax=Phycicoccus flavus TaxID=2502783 RepID=A0A8T6QZI3_9MICO|nr:hypothetical protein [Phycicoccus flavus]NHA67519.1 hypothetical protein [Phycicoccus flavus]